MLADNLARAFGTTVRRYPQLVCGGDAMNWEEAMRLDRCSSQSRRVSLQYLALQIRQNTVTARRSPTSRTIASAGVDASFIQLVAETGTLLPLSSRRTSAFTVAPYFRRSPQVCASSHRGSPAKQS